MTEKTAERTRAAGRPRRRGTSPWRDLFADPVRKLIALALAILLWLFLDSQITDRQRFDFKLIGERSAKETEQSEIHDSHIVVHPPPGYRVTGFRDHMMTNAEVAVVEIWFEAPQHQLRNTLASPGLFVQPRITDINQQTNVYVIDQAELRAADPAVIRAVRDMKPRRIDVLLERVDERPIALDKTALKVVYPDSKAFPDFVERLRLDVALFAPQQITLRGPRSLIGDVARNEPLFVLDLSHLGASIEPKLVVQLVPIPIEKVTIDGGPVTITVPLDPQFEPVQLTVPVLVNSTSRSTAPRDDFEHDPTVKVNLLVSGELAAVLSRLPSESERDEWAKQNAYVMVRLDDNWRNENINLLGTLWLMDTHYERGRHYRTEGLLSVQIRPRPKVKRE